MPLLKLYPATVTPTPTWTPGLPICPNHEGVRCVSAKYTAPPAGPPPSPMPDHPLASQERYIYCQGLTLLRCSFLFTIISQVQAARRSLLKIPTMHDTFALGSEKGPWRLIEFTPKSLSGVCPGYALCFYIQLPLKNIYHIISICLLISHP